VGETHDNLEAVRLTERLQPHVLILTIPALSGLDTLRLVREVAPQTQAVVLSQFKNSALVIEAMKSGATGYVLKRCSEENLVRAVRAAANGTCFFSPPVKASLEQIDQDRQESLTPREREVLRQEHQSTDRRTTPYQPANRGKPSLAFAAQTRLAQSFGTRALCRPPRTHPA
jgi:DNA-binding NarL/FixJ family response regulator